MNRARAAAAIAAGGTVMCCDWPALDGTATADRCLNVTGWAYSGAGIQAIAITLGGRSYQPVIGIPRPDVDRELPGLNAQVSGFWLVIDTEGWEVGPYELGVYVFGNGGQAAGQTGTIQIGTEAPYRAWLRDRPSAGSAAGIRAQGSTSLDVRVVSVGGADDALRASLADQTHLDASLVDGPIADLLRSVADGGAPLVLVEDRGALTSEALSRIAAAMSSETPPDLVYADEDAVMPDGGRGAAFLKPEWSPELLLSLDYIGPLVVVGPAAARAALATERREPSTIYELLLSLIDERLRVERVPEPLFTSRVPRVPADGKDVAPAIQRLFERRGREAEVEDLPVPAGARAVRWKIDATPLVSIIVPTSMSAGLVERCLESVAARTTYRKLEVVVVYSGDNQPPEMPPELEHRVVRHRAEFNFSAAINAGARVTSGDYLVLLNDDTEVRSPEWLERMLDHALTPGVGIVGCKLLYPDDRIQHAGLFIDVHDVGAWHLHVGLPADAPGYRGMLRVSRNLSAVTGACMMMSRDLFVQLDGLDESYHREFSDIDICLRAIERGRRVVWTPDAVLTHHERSSLPREVDSDDRERFIRQWRARYVDGDPFYHPAFRPASYGFPVSYEYR